MKPKRLKSILTPALVVSLLFSMIVPLSAFRFFEKEPAPSQSTTQTADGTNQIPISRNLSLSTYKNIAITGYLDAVDYDGDTLTFKITSNPARGAITMSEDGSSQFVYTPYENKVGKDSFSYIAIDSNGNVSSEAVVSIKIEKPKTAVTYADMQGNSAHKAAVRLAEDGVYIGRFCAGEYFFDPDAPLSRTDFLCLSMSVCGVSPIADTMVTGFYDDAAIPTWAKGYASSALSVGAISGSLDDTGKPVFLPNQTITQQEASVILDNLLHLSDATVTDTSHWAAQSVANLSTTGILPANTEIESLSAPLTRASAAMMLDGVCDLLSVRR